MQVVSIHTRPHAGPRLQCTLNRNDLPRFQSMRWTSTVHSIQATQARSGTISPNLTRLLEVSRLRILDTVSHSLDASSHSPDASSQSLDAFSHSPDASSRSLDASSRSLDASSHSLDASSRSLDAYDSTLHDYNVAPYTQALTRTLTRTRQPHQALRHPKSSFEISATAYRPYTPVMHT